MYTQVRLVLKLINVKYLESIVSSIEKGSNGQNHSSSNCHHLINNPLVKLLIPVPSTIWKTLRYKIHPVSRQSSCSYQSSLALTDYFRKESKNPSEIQVFASTMAEIPEKSLTPISSINLCYKKMKFQDKKVRFPPQICLS